MKDTVIKNTGDSRWMRSAVPEETTWEDALSLLRSGTFPVDLAGKNAEGIQQDGMPLTKANLLSDETATLLGGVETPNEALAAIPAVIVNPGWRVLTELKTAGSYTFVPPDLFNGQPYKIGVAIVGGGGGGGDSTNSSGGYNYANASGGGSGYTRFAVLTVTPGTSYAVVVGAGGAPETNGGTSAFAGLTAEGGGGGRGADGNSAYGSSSNAPQASGGQSGRTGGSSSQTTTPYGGQYTGTDECYPAMSINPFTGDLILAAGGSACAGSDVTTPTVTLPGGVSSAGASKASGSVTATKGTLPGCGGGAASCFDGTATAAPGCDGMATIYVQGVAQ